MPRLLAPPQEVSARFDFLEGLRRYNYTVHVAGVLDEYEQKAAASEADGRGRPSTMEEAGDLIADTPLYQFSACIQRQAQQLGWAAARESLKGQTEFIQQQIDAPPADPVGRLVLDPELNLPEYYTHSDDEGLDDIHLVSGGYWGDPLVGAVYERGGALYRLAWRVGYAGTAPGALKAFAAAAPADDYRRILDMGCSFGGLTMAFREVYPEAEEVMGGELSASALRWAHLTAEERGLPIAFEQRDATATGFPSESFDLLTGFLLLHELSPEVLDAVMTESFRILRPGGHIRFLDVPPYEVLPPEVAFLQSFDTRGNGEVFWDGFLSRDFKSLLGEIGFVEVSDGPLDYDEPGYWGTAALMRDGKFRPENRWVTEAFKPTG